MIATMFISIQGRMMVRRYEFWKLKNVLNQIISVKKFACGLAKECTRDDIANLKDFAQLVEKAGRIKFNWLYLQEYYSQGFYQKEMDQKDDASRVERLARKKVYRYEKLKETRAVWQGMKDRCLNESNSNFHNYGGRGINICSRWLKFSNFLEDMGYKGKDESIERIDVNGNYEPSNCKWIPKREQAKNMRRSLCNKSPRVPMLLYSPFIPDIIN